MPSTEEAQDRSERSAPWTEAFAVRRPGVHSTDAPAAEPKTEKPFALGI